MFVTSRIAYAMFEYGVPIPNFYVACAWSLLFFLLMVVATTLVAVFPEIVLSLPRAMTAR